MATTKCYVGTYHKYNSGSLAGAWLDLSNYENYAAFVAACRELHKNECEPEFMIQDWESLPDGFSSSEWINEQEFNDIKEAMQEDEKANLQIVDYSEKAIALVGDTKTIKEQLKQLGGRFNPKLSCGAGWVFPKSKLDEVQKFVNCGEITKGEKVAKEQRDEALWNEYKKLLLRAHGEHWLNDYLKDTSDLMRTESGVIIAFEKKKLKTEFCWHDEGPQYEAYKQVTKTEKSLSDYFTYENLKDYDELIEQLKTRKNEYGGTMIPVYYEIEYCNDLGRLGYARDMHMRRDSYVREDEEDPRTKHLIHRMSENEAKQALRILKNERKKMEKRIQTYLKRYGTSKLHTWTYWADR